MIAATLNRHGHRLGTSELYRVVEDIDQVLDSLVVDIEFLGRPSWMPLFVVLREGEVLDHARNIAEATDLPFVADGDTGYGNAMNVIRTVKGLARAGAAAVMIDVHSGEILSLASQPSFDPNRLADRVSSKYYDEIEKTGGWLNRATQGLYPPGSTFKVITATAGMRKKVVDWDDVLDCGPFFRVGNRDYPEHEPVGYGEVNLDKMLAVSCNVWNYQIGLRTGIEALAAESRRFGLDAPLLQTVSDMETGGQPMTELPFAASRGLVVPDRAYKLRIGAGAWNDGDTANLSIGQGYLLTTPLHMACVAASIARGETRTVPSIIHSQERTGRHIGSVPIGLNADQLEALRGGMVRCVEEGTARVARIPGLVPGRTRQRPLGRGGVGLRLRDRLPVPLGVADGQGAHA